jgi:hypothetical protein
MTEENIVQDGMNVHRNSKVHWFNDCYGVKAINVTQRECVHVCAFVALGIQHAIRVRHIFFSSGFGGLMVSMLASGAQVRGLKPGRNLPIFRTKKSSACLSSEGK